MKDEELQRLAKELRAKDFVLKEIANKLKQTAEAAKAAEDAARKMDDERRFACTEIERLTEDAEKQMHATLQKVHFTFLWLSLFLIHSFKLLSFT